MKLKLFRINDGGQFSGDHKLEVDFEESKLVALGGESGEGKTTGLECFKIILGVLGGEKVINDLTNRDSGKLDIEHTFVGKDKKTYFVKATKSSYYVREEGSTKNIGEPKSFIEQHLGKVAADPMRYKNANMDDFLKWLAGFSDMGAEGFEKEFKKHKETISNAEETRAKANKEAKARRVLLADADYIDREGNLVESKWVAAEKKYAKPINIKELSAKLDEVGKKSDRLLQAETKLKELKTQEAELLAKLAEIQTGIKKGEAFVEANKTAKKEYADIKEQFDNAALFAAEYESFQTILKQRDEMYQYEEIAQRADALVQATEKKKKELQWQVIPDIRGAEILLEDEGSRKAGFYVGGFNSRQQSASEYLTAIVKILDKIGCRILILDDVATYGSEFRQQLEKLSKKGWYILYSILKVDQELTIEYL